jgi:hypothetical protein
VNKTHLLSILLLAALAATVQAAEVTVQWTFPTNNVDGSALTDLAGAKVYYGTASSNYTSSVTVPGGVPGGVGVKTITGLKAGTTYYFVGTAYNVAGLESDHCAEVSKKATTKPSKVTLRVL